MNDIITTEIVPPAQAVLDKHAEALAEHTAAIRGYAQRTIESLIEIGRHLAEVKELLGYTNWVPWLEREFAWSESTAERFIALHGLQRLIPQVGDWDIPISGLYLLAEKSTPPEVINAVAAKVEAGERVMVAEIKKAKAKRKPSLASRLPTTLAPPATASAVHAAAGKTATAKSKDHLQWFAVACREYLPHVTVKAHRLEARRLVAELTKAEEDEIVF